MLISSFLYHFYNANTAVEHNIGSGGGDALVHVNHLVRRVDHHSTFFVVAACLIPVLVILSGIFAGLTLGYMSLDETQLTVLATSGTPQQQEYAKKIIPVRRNGHLLLVSLLLANMVVNETLPVISDEVLGGGVPAVAVSTVLIVIFSEIIPQSICSRYGLYIGAKCAIPVRILMYSLWIIAWPVAKMLEAVLGPHHGIMYRRAELKELINLHSNVSPHGGDLKHDTVNIIGHTLDLQEKVVKDAMTPIDKVFMLHIDATLNYETLRRVCESGHSRVPVYEEVEVKVGTTKVAKKIVGVLLVKQCVLLDPQDETPLRSLPLNKLPSIPYDEPLLTTLDRFQEGRSHMAIVSLFSNGRAASVREAAKTDLTRRFLKNVGFGDGEQSKEDLEKAWDELREGKFEVKEASEHEKPKRFTGTFGGGREQTMPADAVMTGERADDFLKGIDTHVNPLGLITLEDVLEELIGEEIYDEFDLTGPQSASKYIPPAAVAGEEEEQIRRRSPVTEVPPPLKPTASMPAVAHATHMTTKLSPGIQFPKVNIFGRSRSQPGRPRSPSAPSRTVPSIAEKVTEKDEYDDRKDDEKGMTDTTTDGTTLHPTLTIETDATLLPDGSTVSGSGGDSMRLPTIALPTIVDEHERRPSIVSFAERGRVSSAPGTPRNHSPSTRNVTEAILQTQTRRRAAHLLPPGNTAGVDASHPPAVRQVVPKGRFKSSPLSPIGSLAPVPSHDEDHADDDKDKADTKCKDEQTAGIVAWNERTHNIDEQEYEYDTDIEYDDDDQKTTYSDPYIREPREGL
ncbi:hypothetical protein Clacol_008589 [Clathrus columnatus]|uniref:CNNM transmembrane domain-containing protein n=1 Tax=Clathrus columnatus TaxID=1419009 RepID=A0AAV5AIY8_9AGAM|nr:hypothetical protein Clacol_008589 [Clathrus columnatus]